MAIDERPARELLAMLGGDRFHSGRQLAERLGISRTAVWKRIRRLEAMGFRIDAIRGKGYRLDRRSQPLRAEAVRESLSGWAREAVEAVDCRLQVGSTNQVLLDAAGPFEGARVCTAEVQTAGRGRRGRRWLGEAGGALAVSAGFDMDSIPPGFGGLSLAVGACLAEELAARGVPGVSVKWPNDLLVDDAKLAGILIELAGEPPGRCRVVVGVGMNYALGPRILAGLDRPAVNLADLAGAPDRVGAVALIVESVLEARRRYAAEGLAACIAAWRRRDALLGRELLIADGRREIAGIGAGIDDDGCLLLDTPDGRRRFHSADVSVTGRKASGNAPA